MFQVETDKAKNLLKFVFSGRVTPEETKRWREKLDSVLKELPPGFKILSDLSNLESMDIACAPDIEWSMEACDKAGASKVVRVIPDSHKDIGLSIMSIFHYRRRIPMVTCETLEEANKILAE